MDGGIPVSLPQLFSPVRVIFALIFPLFYWKMLARFALHYIRWDRLGWRFIRLYSEKGWVLVKRGLDFAVEVSVAN